MENHEINAINKEDFVISYTELIKRYGRNGMATALVYGRMERYSKMGNKCTASVHTLATAIGISDASVSRAIRRLRIDGYIYCETSMQRWADEEGNYKVNEYTVIPLSYVR